MRWRTLVFLLTFLAGIRFAAAGGLCPPHSECERENARRIAAASINTRYRPCAEVYPGMDVAAAARNRTPIDPQKAKECVVRIPIPIRGATFYVPQVDLRTKFVTLRELADPVETIRGELDFRDALAGVRREAVVTFAAETARNFDDRYKGALVVPEGVITVKTIPVSGRCPEGLSGTPPSCLAPAPKPSGRVPEAARPGIKSPQVVGYQAALNAIAFSGLATDGDYGWRTKRAVLAFQKRFNRKMRREHVIHEGQQAVPENGILDAETAAQLIREFQRKQGMTVTGLIDEATETALAAQARMKRTPGPSFFQGEPADFQADPAQEKKIRGYFTVFYPSRAASARERRMEGTNYRNRYGPVDRFGQNVCTAEDFLQARCDYVTGGIDQRLQMENGTPLRSFELEKRLAEAFPQYRERIEKLGFPIRVTTTGGCSYFRGPGHVDLAMASRITERGTVAAVVAKVGGDVDLVFPQGYQRDTSVRNSCRN